MSLFVVLCLFWSFNSVLMADGMIFPYDPIERERFILVPPQRPDANFTVPLSVRKHHVKIAINNLAATTAVDQIFFNHENRTIEGLYIFPLPIGASISGFAMDIEGKMTSGELMDADKARKIYEDIVRQMRDPGLLEYLGQGIFKTRIYPIEGLKEKSVKIVYQEALKMEGELVRYVYPLNIDRYSKDKMKNVAIEAVIKSDLPIASVYSPSHKISVSRRSEKEVVIGFEADELQPDKDFVVYYSVAKKDIAVTVINHRPDPTEDGTFMLMLAPSVKDLEEKTPTIDVALVMDTSGSMAGKKIDQAKKALEFCVNSISQDSNFILCNFSTEAETYKSGLQKMSPEIREGALNYVRNLDAMGGTNISEAMEIAINALNKSDSGNSRFIVFVTDGKPTAGLTEADDILKAVNAKNSNGIRIFSFGIGDQLNAELIDSLAEQNGGVSDYVSEDEDLEIKISSLFSKLTHPVLTDVGLQFNNVEVSQVYPRKMQDLFKDSNILVLGRYSKPGAARITLTGHLKQQQIKLDFEADFPAREAENAFVAKIWATRKIGFLLEQIRKNGSDEELKNEIISLAKRYGILTPYTSYLVLEDNDKFGPDLRSSLVPESMPAADFEEAKAKFSVQRLQSLSDGADAVGASREMNSLKMAAAPHVTINRTRPENSNDRGLQMPDTRTLGAKTFYLVDTRWVDSEIKNQKPDYTIKAWSKAYFAICSQHPELARYLSLGEKMLILYAGKVIEITPDRGEEDAIDLQ
jgi:Ca-activated chloride channel family protein